MLEITYEIGLYCTLALLGVIVLYSSLQSLLITQKNVTYRITQIPPGWDSKTLWEALAADPGANLEFDRVGRIHKDARRNCGVATITYKQTPGNLRQIKRGQFFTTPRHALSLDRDFFNLTVLHVPAEKDHEIDVVIVPGLGGHAFGSFKERDGLYMWPRDALPEELSDKGSASFARVMTYGYDATLYDKNSTQTISDIAEGLCANLLALCKTNEEMKPIVFVGHSMGGLLIKQALLSMSESDKANAARVFRAARGIAFFGVPNFGMHTESVDGLVRGGANAQLLHSLSAANSQYLRDLARRFDRLRNNKVSDKLECVYFFETELSPTAKANWFGKYMQTGKPTLLVQVSSASSYNYGDISMPIKRTHSDMVKFYGPQDSQWQAVAERLKALVSDIRHQVQKAAEEELKANYNNVIDECRRSLGLDGIHIFGRSHALQKDRLPGTCEWLFEDSEYIKWKNIQSQDPSHILAFRGKPGSGKSVPMQAAIDDCDASSFEPLSFFFDGRPGSLPQERTELAMYKALLFQLLLKLGQQELVDVAPAILTQDKSDAHRNGNRAELWCAQDIWQAMTVVLDRMHQGRLVVLIDAVDECDGLKMSSLPNFVTEMRRSRVVRLCLSVRIWRPLSVFEGRPDMETLDVASYNKADIDSLIVTRLQELQLQVTRPRVFEQMLQILTSRAANVFQWARLVVDHIQEQELGSARTDRELISYVNHIPGELTSLYRHLMQQIATRDHPQTCVLMLLVQVSKRPLSPDEIRSVLECCGDGYGLGEPGALKGIDMMMRIQSLSGGLVECHVSRHHQHNQLQHNYHHLFHHNNPNQRRPAVATQTCIVRLMHQSVGDFLLDDAGLGILDVQFKVADSAAQFHLAAFRLCLRTVRCKIDTDCDDVEFPFLPYAVLFWTMHARQGEANMGDDGDDKDGSYAEFLDDCGSNGAKELVRLFKKHNHFLQYKALADSDVPSTAMLSGETSILAFLALAGCTKLVKRHLTNCPDCQPSYSSSSAPASRARLLQRAFTLAVHGGHAATAEAILDHPACADAGIDINGAGPNDDYETRTPLFTACVLGHAETVSMLLSRGADPLRWHDLQFEYALIAAAAHEDTRVVKAILEHCRSNPTLMATLLSAQAKGGYTVFHHAVVQGRSKVLDLLLNEAARAGSDVLVKTLTQGDDDGDTAYDVAVLMLEALEEQETIDIAADEKSLRRSISKLEGLMQANKIQYR